MQKGVLAGVAAGILVLTFICGYWFASQSLNPVSTALPGVTAGSIAADSTNSAEAAGQPTLTGTLSADVAPSESSASPSSDKEGPISALASKAASPPWARASAAPGVSGAPLTREERRAIHAQVRMQMNALLAKGSKVSLVDVEAFIDEAEKTGKGVFEPQYFDSMREIIKYTAVTQQLSQELGAIAGSNAPRDIARKKAVLVELKEAGNQINNRVALMQSRARDSTQALSR